MKTKNQSTKMLKEAQQPMPGTSASSTGASSSTPEEESSPAVKTLEKRLGKIPDLDKVLGTIRQKDDAAGVLALLAAKLGGKNLLGSKILQTAKDQALEAEKEEKTNQPTAPVTNTGTPTATSSIKEESAVKLTDFLF